MNQKYDKIEEMILNDGDIINPTLHLKDRMKNAEQMRKSEENKYTENL